MKINLLDAGLAIRAGHHYDFDIKLVRHLVAAGHEVQVYTYNWAQDDVFADFNAICPTHRLFNYFHYTDPLEFDPIAPHVVAFHRQSEVLAEELATVAPADLWLWTSFEAHHLMACATVGTTARVVGCVHFDPEYEQRTMTSMLWRHALLEAKRKELTFMLGAVESELRHRFMPLLVDKRFAILPQPYEGPPRTRPSPALKRIGFFGEMRGEKGAALMEPLVKWLAANGYTVVVQSSTEGVDLPEHPQIERLGFVEDFAQPMASCDLVVLPYDPEQYRTKGSGLLAQALALGVPVTGPFGTIPGRVIEQYKVGELFPVTTPAAIIATIKFMDRHYAKFADNAVRAGEMFAAQHGVARYASTMVALAR